MRSVDTAERRGQRPIPINFRTLRPKTPCSPVMISPLLTLADSQLMKEGLQIM